MLVKRTPNKKTIQNFYPNNLKYNFYDFLDRNNWKLVSILWWFFLMWIIIDDNIWKLIEILSFWWISGLYSLIKKKHNQLENILINNPDSIFVYDLKTWLLTSVRDDNIFLKQSKNNNHCKCQLWFKDKGCQLFKLGKIECPVQKCIKEWNILDYHRENYRIVSYPITDDKWNVLSVVVKVKDISNFQKHWKDLRQLAQTDTKTGLYNDRWFTDIFLKKYMKVEKKQKISICFIDLDNFKMINDEFWHYTWDEVLKEVGKRLSDSVRKWEDVVARLSWDEFVILLDNISEENLTIKIEAIKKNLNRSFSFKWKEITISWSVWYAVWEFNPQNYESDIPEKRIKIMIEDWLKKLINKADKSMYHQKRNWKS